MNRPLAFVVGVSRRAKSLLALALLTIIGVGAWGMTHVVSPPPRREAQGDVPAARARARNLALQPSALSLSRKLGQRFLKTGREVTVLEGTLAIGAESRRIIVRRMQNEGGEQVEVKVAGQGAPITWDAASGTLRAGHPADAEASALAERIALDSPDQFVLAQLRGASYTVVVRGVRADESEGEAYSGPLYDVVRVGEPGREEGSAPTWRLYYLNKSTGLLDRVVSEEGLEKVEAVLSDWVERGGELEPSRVIWSRQGQVFMELALTNATHGPRQ